MRVGARVNDSKLTRAAPAILRIYRVMRRHLPGSGRSFVTGSSRDGSGEKDRTPVRAYLFSLLAAALVSTALTVSATAETQPPPASAAPAAAGAPKRHHA